MEEGQEAPSLREIMNNYYAPFAERSSPEIIAKWIQALEGIKTVYPALWNTSLAELERLVELCPEEAKTLLSLFPPLIIRLRHNVITRHDIVAEVTAGMIGMEIEEEVAITLGMLHQLCRAIYLAGYSDGQRKPQKIVLS